MDAPSWNLALGAIAHRGTLSGPPDRSDPPALSSSTEEPITAIGLKPGNTNAERHLDRFKNISGLRIYSPQIAFVTFQGRVPQLSLDPGHSGDKAVGLDGAKNRASIGIDLMNLTIPILPYPERTLRPRETRVAATTRCWNRGEHVTGLGIDLLDAMLGDLK